MSVLGLTVRSLRFRPGTFVASFLSMFLGAAIVMTFASMLDTSTGAAVSAADEETLMTMATVVGGWGLLIVVFAVASTLTLSVHQRAAEMALLRSVGATPAQIRRMIVGESATIAVVAALAAIPPAILAGGLLLDLLQDTGQVTPTLDHRFGPIAVATGVGITLLASTIAAFLTARRTAGMRAAQALGESAGAQSRMSKKRLAAAILFLALGLDLAVITATVMKGEGVDAMATAGQASIFFAIGLAILAPVLIRVVTARLAGLLERRGDGSGYLAALNLRRGGTQMAGALMPIILFTGIASGTLYMQSIENAATAVAGVVQTAEEKNVETLNLVVVGMIALFAAIMLVNTLVAATTYRRQEFGRQRLVGSTPPQVLQMVSLESVVLVGTGVLFGSLASLFTIVPYSIARTGSVVPDSTVAIYLAIVSAAAILTLVSSVATARRALERPAIEAVAGG